MELLIFYPIAGLCVALALGVIFNNSPVGSAMCLIGMMLGLAGIFVLLQAHFIAVLQIIIYAGAIMVLFMFVIMLLNLKQANSADWVTRDKNLFISILTGALALGIVLFFIMIYHCRKGGECYWKEICFNKKNKQIREDLIPTDAATSSV